MGDPTQQECLCLPLLDMSFGQPLHRHLARELLSRIDVPYPIYDRKAPLANFSLYGGVIIVGNQVRDEGRRPNDDTIQELVDVSGASAGAEAVDCGPKSCRVSVKRWDRDVIESLE